MSPPSPPTTLWSRLRGDASLALRRRHGGMRALRALRIAASPREYLARRAAGISRRSSCPEGLRVDPRLGYRFVAPDEIPELAGVLDLARRTRADCEREVAERFARREGKHRIVFDLLSDRALLREPRWIDFALQDELVDSATDYLGSVPVLRRIGLGISLPDPSRTGFAHSQLYHLDGEDFAQWKLLINVSHVGDEDGPFTLASAAATERVLARAGLDVRRRVAAQAADGATTTPRFTDAEVARHTEPHEIARLVGPPGTALLVDTSRCLHYGSRLGPGRERLVLGVVYQRYHLVNESPFNSLADARDAHGARGRMLLAQPRPAPVGAFYPDSAEHASDPAERAER